MKCRSIRRWQRENRSKVARYYDLPACKQTPPNNENFCMHNERNENKELAEKRREKETCRPLSITYEKEFISGAQRETNECTMKKGGE